MEDEQAAVHDDTQLSAADIVSVKPEPDAEGDVAMQTHTQPASGPGSPLDYSHVYTLLGHTRAISSLSFSPDGTLLASASADKTVRIWSLRTGQLVETLKGHGGGISDVAWSPCGRYLATASDDKTVGVWNALSGYDLRRLIGHTSYVFCVAYSPQSNLIVSGSFDETVRLWDVRKGTCHRTIAAHSEAVTDVDFNRDGTLIASCSYDGLIRLWDVPTGLCLATLPHPTSSPTTSIRFSPSSSHLLASSLDSTLRLWDVANGKIVKTYRPHRGERDNKDGGEGATSAAGGKSGVGGVYQNHKYAIKSHFLVLPAEGTAVPTTTPQSEVFIVSGSEDSKLYCWDLQSRRIPEQGGVVGAGVHRDVVGAVAVHPKTREGVRILASAGMEHDPSVRVWFDRRQDNAES
ncbi:WD40 repeat-like protein [Microstroma glucosiphilum]|uniref:WD40 repeat-like protein n=1 Tax=Pseudomicrostroma glucosiphilum TaxID=1684307 RepID=A0A316UBQ0_9BASI|nr:WD40 repeat-like protein [Pseudomicrostroma glucosiphilum]PWN22657.1 WD40 repeat-like protein [Pseudomicrostroma glucosiphilum]